MEISRGSLRTFLETAKRNLQSAILNQQRVTLVIGNESADLDSITSAIVLAYLRSNTSPTPLSNPSVNKHIVPSQSPPLYIPLLNIPRNDIRIRPELLKLLPHANLEPDHLITLDDLSTTAPAGLNPANKETLQPSLTRLILTDHNKLAGPLSKAFSDRVIGCIDHHVDEHSVPEDTGNEPRIITTAGSCTSLVIEFCRKAWDNLNTGSSGPAGHEPSAEGNTPRGVLNDDVRLVWDAEIAKFAIASILIDTSSLKNEDKTVSVDKEADEYLEKKITDAPRREGEQWNRDAFFEEIKTAKQNLDGLSLPDILRKDYKQWTTGGMELGISSVVKPVTWQIAKAGKSSDFVKELDRFRAERNVQLFAIMTTSTSEDGMFRRELLLGSYSDEAESVAGVFAKNFGSDLRLEKWNEDEQLTAPQAGHGTIRVWWQRDVSKSRKQVAPLLRKAIGARGSSL